MNIMIRSMKYEIGGDDAQVMRVKYDDTSVDTDGDAIADVICMFSKKGMCDMHKIKGDMKRSKTKAWRKKKFGYGWVTTTGVTYTCSMAGSRTMESVNGSIGNTRG